MAPAELVMARCVLRAWLIWSFLRFMIAPKFFDNTRKGFFLVIPKVPDSPCDLFIVCDIEFLLVSRKVVDDCQGRRDLFIVGSKSLHGFLDIT